MKKAMITMPEAAILADALDSLGAAVFLVEATSRIVHANIGARALLGSRTVLRAADGTLTACEAGSARTLKLGVAAVAGGGGQGGRRLTVPLPASSGDHCIAHVSALSPRGSKPGVKQTGGAMVLVHRLALELPPSSEVLAALYGLTAAEARVLQTIVEIGSVRETAAALGIAEATVKTHLHRLFGKTGATRQVDLVKLVAGLANPAAAGRHVSARMQHPSPVRRNHGLQVFA
jgi:DNA-binding CsgD family transcriptional regulator